MIYKYEGSGHYLQSVAVVSAGNVNEAIELINETLKKGGLKPTATEENVQPVDDKVIYSFNGDY